MKKFIKDAKTRTFKNNEKYFEFLRKYDVQVYNVNYNKRHEIVLLYKFKGRAKKCTDAKKKVEVKN